MDLLRFLGRIDYTCLLAFWVVGFVSVFLLFANEGEVAVLAADLEVIVSEQVQVGSVFWVLVEDCDVFVDVGSTSVDLVGTHYAEVLFYSKQCLMRRSADGACKGLV